MRKLFTALILLALAASSSFAGDTVPGDVIVVLRKTTSAHAQGTDSHAGVRSFAQSQNLSVTHTFDALSELGGYSFVVVHSDTEDENALLQRLKSRPEVVAASLNSIYTLNLPNVPNDTEYHRLWGMEAINAPQAWTLGTGSEDVYVAVVDSGIDYNHPDLKDNFSHEYSRNFVGVDKEGYDPSAYYDENSHGTHVAGTIAAVGNNALGVTGVNWRAKVFSVRVLNENGAGSASWIVAGLNHIAELLSRHPSLKIAALNYSVGGVRSYTPEQAIEYNDPIFLAFKILGDTGRLVTCMAAGNETLEVGAPTPSTEYSDTGSLVWDKGSYVYPPSYLGLNNSIVVAASDMRLNPASFSNYSRKYVDIAAPGNDIYSTIPTNYSVDLEVATITSPYPYRDKSGTSMATPHVAGAVALLKSIYPDASASQIRAAIIGGANGEYLRDGGTSAYGLLDLKGAIDFMARTLSDDADPAIQDASIPAGVAGQRYRFEFYASGTFPMTWTLDGTLPSGLGFRNGTISGTPTEAGDFTFTVTAANKNASSSLVLTLRIDDAEAPVIDGSAMSYDATVSVDSEVPLMTSRGSWPISWSIDSGDVPGNFGLKIDADAGILSFTPRMAGTFTFSATASNDAGTDTGTFTLRVSDAKPPVILDARLADGTPGRPYRGDSDSREDTSITAEGTRPIAWDVDGLPEGLTFSLNDREDSPNASSITIDGRPKSAGVFTLTVTASNDFGTTSRDFTLTVSDDAPSFTRTSTRVIFYKGIAANNAFTVRGSAPITLSVSGNLPDGLRMNFEDNTAVIHGIPERTGSYSFTINAENPAGQNSLTLDASVVDPIMITSYYLPDGVKGRQYNASIRTLSNVPAQWKVSADASLGLRISQSGDITGTPSEAGNFSVDITAEGEIDFDGRIFSLTVRELPAIITAGLVDARVSTPYPMTELEADGTTPLTWSVSDGRIPAGMTLSANGHIYGTPTESGTFTFTVRAENKAGYDARKLTLKVASSGSSSASPDVPPEPEPEPDPYSKDVKPDIPTVKITQGSARDISSLTIGELAAISNADGLIAAILPEISVNYPGFYTFESVDAFTNVRLSDDVPAGWLLVWNAFTRGGTGSGFAIEDAEDDNVLFYDSDGGITITVPENHILNVSAWLDADTVYAPVISAVKESASVEGVSSGSGGCAAMMPGVAAGLLAVMLRRKSHKEDD